MKYKAALLSEKGGRKRNEDFSTFSERNGYGCYLVADGLGGHYGGDKASKTACKSILEAFEKSPGSSVNHLNSYLDCACKAMERLRAEIKVDNAAKTTLVVLLIGNKNATWAHIGDSRLYYFHSGRIIFQTKDHSIPQRLADIGEISIDQIRFHEDRNLLLKVFEGNDISRFTLLDKEVPINRGDTFLLCSDGFWECIYEAEMENELKRSSTPESWLNQMEGVLLKRVKPKHDNYSALAVIVR